MLPARSPTPGCSRQEAAPQGFLVRGRRGAPFVPAQGALPDYAGGGLLRGGRRPASGPQPCGQAAHVEGPALDGTNPLSLSSNPTEA